MRWIFAGLCLFFSLSAEQNADEQNYWGYHLILDCKSCDVSRITDGQNIRSFVKQLVDEIEMKAYGEPIVEYFAAHDPKTAGFSLLQLIETSSITGHFVDGNGDAYIDIFSCKPFDLQKAKSVVNLFFQPKQIKTTYLTRQA